MVAGMYIAETNKYCVRPIEEKDFEDVRNLLKTNEYLGLLWSTDVMPEDKLDEFVRRIYMRQGTYCVMDKETNAFCGYISLLTNEFDGELSVRMMGDMDVSEIMGMFGKVLENHVPAKHKNLTIQYSFE